MNRPSALALAAILMALMTVSSGCSVNHKSHRVTVDLSTPEKAIATSVAANIHRDVDAKIQTMSKSLLALQGRSQDEIKRLIADRLKKADWNKGTDTRIVSVKYLSPELAELTVEQTQDGKAIIKNIHSYMVREDGLWKSANDSEIEQMLKSKVQSQVSQS